LRFLLFLPIIFPLLPAQSPTARWDNLAAGLFRPTFAASAHDGSGRLFITEQDGQIQLFSQGQLSPVPFLDLRDRVFYGGESGLLSIAFPPQFSEKQYFYVCYVDMELGVKISRFRVSENPDIADPASETTILYIPQVLGQHNGGMMAFGPHDGMLYISVGDGGIQVISETEFVFDPFGNGQRLDTHRGKILRIDTESGVEPYAIPEGNPALDGALPEIFAYGLRNPWRFSFDRANGDLFIGDVGNDDVEEVNYIPVESGGGQNFGWSIREGFNCFREITCGEAPETVAPISAYGHDIGCSVTGGYVYRGSRYPALYGAYLFGDYCSGSVWTLRRTEEGWERSELGSIPGLLVSFAEDEDGEIMAVAHGGKVFRLEFEEPPVETVSDRRNPAVRLPSPRPSR